ncbi:UNVERIFIED_ORG: hypothetical protein J2W74_003411 [Methylorubrum zatmanii]
MTGERLFRTIGDVAAALDVPQDVLATERQSPPAIHLSRLRARGSRRGRW